MKLLHFGEESNFIIRPAQRLEITQFGEYKNLKQCYCYIKYLKSIGNIDISSYFIKKVLLTDKMKKMSMMENSLEWWDVSDTRLKYDAFDLMNEALKHPDLAIKFDSVFDLEALRKNKDIKFKSST